MESFDGKEDRGLQKRLQRDEAEFEKHGKKFKQFDVIMSDELMSIGFDEEHGGGGDFRTRKIMEEWRILEKGLPRNIYVRAHKGNNHFLRAVILGKEGTPYHDGLFFFDIQFPASYPNEPPVVTYLSDKDFRLHPLLDADGKVCLSLLNTNKTKDSKEKWNSDLSKSNVLEVLKCIQERILPSKPYFDKQPKNGILPKWYLEKKSKSYNKKIYVLNCKTMLKVLQKPPKHFEFFVAQHFRDRGQAIIKACLAYIEGEKVGTRIPEDFFASPPPSPTSSSSSPPSSPSRVFVSKKKKFQAAMDDLCTELYEVLLKIGATMEDINHFGFLEVEDSKSKKKDIFNYFRFLESEDSKGKNKDSKAKEFKSSKELKQKELLKELKLKDLKLKEKTARRALL